MNSTEGFDTVEQHLYHDTVTWRRAFVVDESAARKRDTEYRERCCIKPAPTKNVCPRRSSLSHWGHFERRLNRSRSSPPSSRLIRRTFELEEEQGELGTYISCTPFWVDLILNVMPCVLPVLAIKILSFVKQAGEDRMRVLQLNIAYSAGVILVFLCLASLAAFLEMGWGSLFQHAEFNLVMACLVFVMGLSLLGVFEIPIPGLSRRRGAQKEGLPGAFLTGIFATFLATPCSGPL